MNSILYPTCATVTLLAFFYKVRVLRTDRSTAQLALAANHFLLFVTFALSTPVVWAATSHILGVTNLSGLISLTSVIISAGCQQMVILHLAHEPDEAWRKAKPRLLMLTLIVAAMVTLFFTQNNPEQPDNFTLANAEHNPAYLIVYLIGYTLNQVDVGVLGWRYSKIAPTPWLRRGLMSIALTMPFAMVYAMCRVADIVAAEFGSDGAAWEPVTQISVSLAAIIKTVGWTLPDWGRHISTILEWFECHRTYRQLAPLHAKVTSHAQAVILRLEPADIRGRLYRRVVEIRDAQWALRHWMYPSVAELARVEAIAAQLHGSDLAATVEAARLAAALQSKNQGIGPSESAGSPLEAEPQDLATELAFQCKVASAFAKSPVVKSILATISINHASAP